MSDNEGKSPFFDEFLDDYFAESDTHLTSIRSNLLSLESLVDRVIDEKLTSEAKLELKSLVDELLRSFHTLKGLSGMVGVKEAEELAHQMESYLRALRGEQRSISHSGMEVLIAGVKVLEETIASRRTKTQAPDIAAVMAQIGSLLSDGRDGNSPSIASPPTPSITSSIARRRLVQLKPEELELLRTALSKGDRAWHIEFVPDRDRAERGINVNYVRSRLQEVGELIHASPRLAPDAKTLFDFVVASAVAGEDFFPDGEKDGISYGLFAVAEVAEAVELPADPHPAPSPLSPPSFDVSQSVARTATKTVVPEPTAEMALAESEAQEKAQEEIPIASPLSGKTPQRQSGLSVMPSNVVRVDLARLDDLMRMLGELVISRARLEDQLTRLQDIVPSKDLRPIRETSQTLERQLRDLRQGVMRVRLVPIGQVFSRMQFVVRDVAAVCGKKVRLELEGEETEIDKYMVERLMDPLLHLVRNAISHGLESESDRLQVGKPGYGNLTLRATASGEMVILEVEDDGLGVDVSKVAERGIKMGAIESSDLADSLSLLDLLCLSGLSTKEQADLTSGRGVGLAVVKNTALELGGILSLDTTPGQGTKFTIELPLTLAIADALIVSVGQQTFAVPESSVLEAIEVEPDKITTLEDWDNDEGDRTLSPVKHGFTELLSFRQDVLPLRRLAHLFGLEQKVQDRFHAVIIGKGLHTVGIVVDRIVGRREIVVQPLSDPLLQVPGLAGATELGDGRVVLILDVATLIRLSKDSQRWEKNKQSAVSSQLSAVSSQ